MKMGERYKYFFKRKDVYCCQCIPFPLPSIPVKTLSEGESGNNNRHDTHYYNYAFECLECGAVYEVIIQDYSYTSIGDFMCPNYTSWSVRPALKYLENHPTLSQELLRANGNYLKQKYEIDKLIMKLEDKIYRKINKLKNTTGELNEKQTIRAKKRLCNIELKLINEHEKQQQILLIAYIKEARAILGLPKLDAAYKKSRTNKYYQSEKLQEELEDKQKQLSSIIEMATKLASKDKLSSDIRKLEHRIKELTAEEPEREDEE